MPISSSMQTSFMWAIFAATYLGLALGRIPGLVLERTGIALLGAIGMLLVGGVTLSQAARHIDYETLTLLFGLMIFSAQLHAAGFYDAIGRRLTKLADRPTILLAGVIAASAGVAALLANDIVCLAFTPLICAALLKARRDPIPYLVALATASNIGSAATIIGNPQNMYIGTAARLPFGKFAAVMSPLALAGLVICWAVICVVFRGRLLARGAETANPADRAPDPAPIAVDRFLVVKTLVLLGGLVVCFFFARGPWRAIAALAGAGALLVSSNRRARRLQENVDWNLMLLFIGLFIVNGAMQQHGLIQAVFQRLAGHGLDVSRPLTLSAVTTVLSNCVSNVPAVLLLQPAVASVGQARLWYLLALISTWAGNLTLVGSIANLIVCESAARLGVRLDLKTYCKVGVPLTLVTVTMGTLWLMIPFIVRWLG